MTETYVDGAGYRYSKPLPKLNLELLQDVVKWVLFKAGVNGNPAWEQGNWQCWMIDNEVASYDQTTPAEYSHIQPGTFDQKSGCGSAYCCAGYVVSVSGYTKTLGQVVKDLLPIGVDAKKLDLTTASQWYTELIDPGAVGFDGNLVDPQVHAWGELDWSFTAQKILGITDVEADCLFGGDNDADDIERICEDIARSRGLELDLTEKPAS